MDEFESERHGSRSFETTQRQLANLAREALAEDLVGRTDRSTRPAVTVPAAPGASTSASPATSPAAVKRRPIMHMRTHRSRPPRSVSSAPSSSLSVSPPSTASRRAAGSTRRPSWRGLAVAPERRCAPYDADDYRYPQSVEDRIIGEGLGGVYGPYTGRWFASKSETDIEHIVARSEAHDSGLCAADRATRRRFATDLLNLTLAGPRVNRYEKVDHDAAEWLPTQNRCWFAARVIAVRQRYGLSIDQREADALDQVLAGCASTALITVARGAAPATAVPTVAVQTRSPHGTTTGTVASVVRSSGTRDRAGDARPPRPIRSCGTAMETAWSANGSRCSPPATGRTPRWGRGRAPRSVMARMGPTCLG